jgi:hypothetical protein
LPKGGSILVKLKILTIVLTITCVACDFGYAQLGRSHRWTDVSYFGASIGTYSVGEDKEGYFVNAIGFYHSTLEHINPQGGLNYFSNIGFLGTVSFFGDPEKDLSGTFQLSKGFWLNEYVLIQLAAGPTWSESNDWGWSSIAILNGNFTEWIELLVGKEETINTSAVFIKADRYPGDIFGSKWRFSLGLSLGVGYRL